jgi:hypothetical protein
VNAAISKSVGGEARCPGDGHSVLKMGSRRRACSTSKGRVGGFAARHWRGVGILFAIFGELLASQSAVCGVTRDLVPTAFPKNTC